MRRRSGRGAGEWRYDGGVMRYALKEKLWSLVEHYKILDERGEPAFEVIGKFFSWGDDVEIRSLADGRQVARIEQKLLSWMPTYTIHRDERPFATVVKEFSWWNKKFTVDVPGPNDYVVTGSFWERDYTFERSGRVVARASREMWTWADTYGIEIVPGEDDVTVLATAVVIDMVLADEER